MGHGDREVPARRLGTSAAESHERGRDLRTRRSVRIGIPQTREPRALSPQGSSSDKPSVSPLPAAAEPPPRRRALSPVGDEREELAALHETALGLIERLDLGDLLEAIVERAAALVG